MISQKSRKAKTCVVAYETDFETNEGTWFVGKSNYNRSVIENGNYILEIDTSGWQSYSSSPYSTVNFPYIIKTKVRLTAKNEKGFISAGFIFDHVDNYNYKIFSISNNGTYTLYQIKEGKYIGLIYATVSPLIAKSPDLYNSIELHNRQTKLEIYINGGYVISHPISRIDAYGRVGLFSETFNDERYAPSKCYFDNFVLEKTK